MSAPQPARSAPTHADQKVTSGARSADEVEGVHAAGGRVLVHRGEVVREQLDDLGAELWSSTTTRTAHRGATSTLTCSVDSLASVKITPLTGGTSE